MQMTNVKVCIECKSSLARYWNSSFCEKCFSQLLREHLAEEDERHAIDGINKES